jgi:uncharacterized protein YjgD (DUF1641 family)
MIKIEKCPIIGSYHKTGTCLIKSIFEKYCEETGYEIQFTNNFHSLKQEDLKERKSLSIIRHPYEIIMSGTRYHLSGKEDWLHKKSKNKKSYFENITSLKSLEEQINYEASNVGKKTILAIYEDIKNKKNTLFVKLENFWANESIENLSKKISQHMNLDNEILSKIMKKLGSKKINFTNSNFNYTWEKHMTKNNLEYIKKILPADVFSILGY